MRICVLDGDSVMDLVSSASLTSKDETRDEVERTWNRRCRGVFRGITVEFLWMDYVRGTKCH
jgi:hypothetical protein